MKLLNADDMKISLIDWLLKKNKNKENFVLCNEVLFSSNQRRADIVMLHNSVLIGFEIKSDIDGIYKLKDQIKDYQYVFDETYVVTTRTNLSKIKKILSDKIGLICISSINVKVIRKAKRVKRLSKKQLLYFCNKSTLTKAIKTKRLIHEIYDFRLETEKKLTLAVLKKLAYESLYKRYSYLFMLFLKDKGKRKTKKDDILNITEQIKHVI